MTKDNRSTRNPSSTRAWIPAACIVASLSVAPSLALAGAPPSLPADSNPAPAATPTNPEPTVTAPATAAPAVASGAPAPGVPAPRVEPQLSLRGTTIWDGLEDKQVKLSMADGTTVAGTVVTQSATNIALARATDGMIVSVPKAEVESVNMRPQSVATTGGPGGVAGEKPLDSGRGLRAGGVAMLTLGAPLALSGTVMLGVCASCVYIHLPLLLPGIGLIIGGSVALKRSKTRHQAFRKAWGIPIAGRVQMMPAFAMTRGGGEVGFTMRF